MTYTIIGCSAGGFSMNSPRVFGLPVLTMRVISPKYGNQVEVLTHDNERHELCCKLVLRENRLVGCAIVGDTDDSRVAGLIREGDHVSPFKDDVSTSQGIDGLPQRCNAEDVKRVRVCISNSY